jgi:hypothetical protein
LDLPTTDSNVHQVALDNGTVRPETLDILDARSNVLNTQSLTSSFNGAVYLVWNVSGHVKINVALTGGAHAVFSGFFFDGGSGGAVRPLLPDSS